MDNSWSWANLSEPQLEKLAEAERTLGVDYLLAFESGKGSAAQGALARAMTRGLPIAPLNESQIECLHGLEQQLERVVVAYGKS